MTNHIWKITATRNNGTVKKGMSAEILKSGTSARPNQREIAEALSDKYKERISEYHVSPWILTLKKQIKDVKKILVL
jgi:hypothetical protein